MQILKNRFRHISSLLRWIWLALTLVLIRVLCTFSNSIAKNLHKLKICLRSCFFLQKFAIQAVYVAFGSKATFLNCRRKCTFGIERKGWKKKVMELKDFESDSELLGKSKTRNFGYKKRGVAGKNWFCPAGKGRHKRLDAGCAEGKAFPSPIKYKKNPRVYDTHKLVTII